MRRTAIAAAWVLGTTVPLVGSAVFLFGCCILPFHGALHHDEPLCHLASEVLRGEHADHDHHHPASTPAREKQQEPVKRVATDLAPAMRLSTAVHESQWHFGGQDGVGYRSLITLGALRCDQDVGSHRVSIRLFRI